MPYRKGSLRASNNLLKKVIPNERLVQILVIFFAKNLNIYVRFLPITTCVFVSELGRFETFFVKIFTRGTLSVVNIPCSIHARAG